MKTALYIIATLKRTGPVNLLFDLIKYMDRSIYNIHVLTLCAEEGDSRWREFEAEGVTLSGMNAPRGFGFITAAPRLSRMAADISPDGKTLALLSLRRLWLITDFPAGKFSSGEITRFDLEHFSHKAGPAFATNTKIFIV